MANQLSQPAEPADVHGVVFVDDLHLDFRNTGRVRALPRAVARGRGRRALLDAATRMTGNALKDEDIARLDPQSRCPRG